VNIGLECGHSLWVDIGAYYLKTMAAAHPLDREWHCPACGTLKIQVSPL
jgi:hypothetical protein